MFWGVLIWKRKAEEALIASGLPYTVSVLWTMPLCRVAIIVLLTRVVALVIGVNLMYTLLKYVKWIHNFLIQTISLLILEQILQIVRPGGMEWPTDGLPILSKNT